MSEPGTAIDTAGPLAGRRILVTRAARQSSKLSEALRSMGAKPVEVPVLEIRPPDSFEPLDAILRNFSSYDWLLLTSANTVHALASRAQVLGLDLPVLQPRQIAAIGSATADAAREIGLLITLIPERYVAESLLAALQIRVGNLYGKRILLVRAKVARDILPDSLIQEGAKLTVVDVYQTGIPTNSSDLLRQALAGGLDAATFTSSSSVQNLASVAHEAGIPFPFKGVPAISIGPITSSTLRSLSWEPAAEASSSDIAGLIDAMRQRLGNND